MKKRQIKPGSRDAYNKILQEVVYFLCVVEQLKWPKKPSHCPTHKKVAEAIDEFEDRPSVIYGKPTQVRNRIMDFGTRLPAKGNKTWAEWGAGIRLAIREHRRWAIANDPAMDARFYWSDEWRRVRYVALKASRGCCELCGEGPSPGKPLHVDHIKPRSLYPNLELDVKNLQVLCADCNLGKGNRDQIDWRKKGGIAQ